MDSAERVQAWSDDEHGFTCSVRGGDDAAMTGVRCYAGSGYPERPVSFEWGGGWLRVSEVLRQARSPEQVVFGVLAEDGACYQLSWLVSADEWDVRRLTNIAPLHLEETHNGTAVENTD